MHKQTMEDTAKEYMRTLTVHSGLELTMDQKGQVVLTVHTERDIARRFHIFGNTVVAHNVGIEKPPTQYASVGGFDAHKGMGDS